MVNPDLKLAIFFLAVAFITRFFLHILGYMGVMLINNSDPGLFSSFGMLWRKWDAYHYLHIAEHGYLNSGEERLKLVFFPLYPAAVRLVYLLTGNYFWAGVIVSNLCLAASCYLMYSLAVIDQDKSTALKAVRYLLFFPVSFFLMAPFSESMYIMLSLITLYFIRKGKWYRAGFCGMLSALTRNMGVLLVIPFITEFILSNRILSNPIIKGFRERNNTSIYNLLKQAAAVLLIPFGTFIYLCINKAVSGEWFRFLDYQKSNWNQGFGSFFLNVKAYASAVSVWSPSDSASLWIPQLFIILGALIIMLLSFNRIRLSYCAYLIAYLFVSVSPSWLLSGPRYVMAAVPIYLTLGALSKNKIIDTILTFIFLIFLGFCTIAFVTGKNIM